MVDAAEAAVSIGRGFRAQPIAHRRKRAKLRVDWNAALTTSSKAPPASAHVACFGRSRSYELV